jgi:lipopolysaccharide transport system permease protein
MYPWEVNARKTWFKLGIRELIHYNDLILSLVKRDLFANYKQSLLGSFWILLQPVMTTLVYIIIFSRIGKISTDGIPAVLFYLPGIILWTYFSECLIGTMNTFIHQSHIFSKVYFPRLAVPISQVLTNSIRLLIQFSFFVLIYIWYKLQGSAFNIDLSVILLPFLVLMTAALSMSCGLIISVLTARYRDIENIIHFLLRLLMFVTPVIYPISIVPKPYQQLLWINPLTPIIETSRVALFSHAQVSWPALTIAAVAIALFSYMSLAIFKRNEIQIMDVI